VFAGGAVRARRRDKPHGLVAGFRGAPVVEALAAVLTWGLMLQCTFFRHGNQRQSFKTGFIGSFQGPGMVA